MNIDSPNHSLAAVAAAVANGLAIVPHDEVSVFLTDYASFAIVEAFCAEVYRRGATPHVILTDERLDRLAVELTDAEQLARLPFIEAASMRHSTVHVSFRGMVPPAARPSVAGDAGGALRLAAQRKAKGAISAMRWRETRWAIVRVPTVEWAAFVGIDPDTLFAEFFAGCLVDWNVEKPAWRTLAHRIEEADTVRIISPDTDLSLRVAGRKSVVYAGEANWPDGEIATAPLEDEVDGYITFPARFYFAGEPIEMLKLEFVGGVVTSATAEVGSDFVAALLDTDSGSRRVGELGIGLNAGMRTATGDLFFDEKILGTVHIALGRSYPECGGTNESSLHWDIVKDLRASSGGGAGSLLLDGQSVLDGDRPLWS
jgi:aminopeptidase